MQCSIARGKLTKPSQQNILSQLEKRRRGHGVGEGSSMGVKTHKHVDYICKIKADIINLDDCPARWMTDWVTDGPGDLPPSGLKYWPGERNKQIGRGVRARRDRYIERCKALHWHRADTKSDVWLSKTPLADDEDMTPTSARTTLAPSPQPPPSPHPAALLVFVLLPNAIRLHFVWRFFCFFLLLSLVLLLLLNCQW